MKLKACHCCGLVHQIQDPRSVADDGSLVNEESRRVYACRRCHSQLSLGEPPQLMRARVAALTLSSLALFPTAVLLPIVEIARLGHHHRSSLLGGIGELFRAGEWGIGSIIFLFSVLFPAIKLLILLDLSLVQILKSKQRSMAHRWMELAGRWSMLDVLLLAILVMWIKLQGVVSFQFGPAIIAFTLCVTLSLLAAIALDPHALWDENL